MAAFDGAELDSGIVLASDGDFYGTTTADGTSNDGTVFKVTTGHALTILHNFTGTDGSGHKSALVQGSDGNFYGTTYSGGSKKLGTVFEITPAGALKTLHSFAGGTEGASPLLGSGSRQRRQLLWGNGAGRHRQRRHGVQSDARGCADHPVQLH